MFLRSPDGQIIRATGKTYAALFAGLGYVPVDLPAPRMRVVAVVHKYPPLHNAGAELMLHAILRRLVAAGDHVTAVVAWGSSGVWNLDGVDVLSPANPDRIPAIVARADVVLTHLDLTRVAVNAARAARRPLVHLVHNDRQLSFHDVSPRDAALVVYNSEWLARESDFEARSIIVRPPVFAKDYATTPGRSVTLVNMTQAKGAQTFYAAARRLPELPFLGVVGAYGSQVTRGDASSNVTIAPHTSNPREDVYAKTAVVLMPSSYESWGRVGIEAACSGIPTIAHPTPGLLESLGDAGIFRDRDDVDGYVSAIRELGDQDVYAEAGARARARAEELELRSIAELDVLEAALLEIGGKA